MAIVPLLFISVWILCEFAMLLDVYIHFTVTSGRRGALLFLWEQMYASGSTFIKTIKPFVILLACLDNTQKNKTARQIIGSPLVLLVWTFDNYWRIGPISSINSSIIYTKRINSTAQTRNSTVLWWLLWYEVILYNSSIFGISINVFKQSFPNLKISGYIFWVLGWFDSKLLNIIISQLLKSAN